MLLGCAFAAAAQQKPEVQTNFTHPVHVWMLQAAVLQVQADHKSSSMVFTSCS